MQVDGLHSCGAVKLSPGSSELAQNQRMEGMAGRDREQVPFNMSAGKKCYMQGRPR